MTITQFRSVWKPWVTTAAEEIVKRFPHTGNQGTYPGHDPDESQAVDFMVAQEQKGLGYRISRWLANESTCRRLDIWYVIWWGEIWSMTRPTANGTGWSGERGWLRYFDANNTNPSRSHHNHVHVSFYGKAPVGFGMKAVTKKAVTLTVTKKTQGYVAKTGKSKGPKYLRPPGRKLTGVLVNAHGDGVYLRTKYGTDYPADSGNFAGRPKKD